MYFLKHASCTQTSHGVTKMYFGPNNSNSYPRDEPASSPLFLGLRAGSCPQNRLSSSRLLNPHVPSAGGGQGAAILGSWHMASPPIVEKCTSDRWRQVTVRIPDGTLSPMSTHCTQQPSCTVSHEAWVQHVPLFTGLCSQHWGSIEAHSPVLTGLTVQLEQQDILIVIRTDSAWLCT